MRDSIVWRPFTIATFVTIAVAAGSLGTATSCGPQPGANDDAGEEDPPEPGCPFDMPAQESRCPEVSLECEYGQADRLVCNWLATCGESGWIVIPPEETCPTGNDPSCPSDSVEIERDTECELHGILCSYNTATCVCEGVAGPGGADWSFKWACAETDDPSCPMYRPRLGGSCFEEGQRCSYGGCNLIVRNVTEECIDGRWQRVADNCGGDAGTSDVADGESDG
jgi:hypothetical protein